MASKAMTLADVQRSISDRAFRKGSFLLSSGRTSKYYIDKYVFSTDPQLLTALASLLSRELKHFDNIDRIAGADMGGVPLVAVTACETGKPCLFVRNKQKEYGTKKQIEGKVKEGDSVVVIEDVATSGKQAIDTAKILQSHGLNVLGVIAVIDREEGAREAIESENFAFRAVFTRSMLLKTNDSKRDCSTHTACSTTGLPHTIISA